MFYTVLNFGIYYLLGKNHILGKTRLFLVYFVLFFFLAEITHRDLKVTIPSSHSVSKYLIRMREASIFLKHALSLKIHCKSSLPALRDSTEGGC